MFWSFLNKALMLTIVLMVSVPAPNTINLGHPCMYPYHTCSRGK